MGKCNDNIIELVNLPEWMDCHYARRHSSIWNVRTEYQKKILMLKRRCRRSSIWNVDEGSGKKILMLKRRSVIDGKYNPQVFPSNFMRQVNFFYAFFL